jgi:hypothetical protein
MDSHVTFEFRGGFAALFFVAGSEDDRVVLGGELAADLQPYPPIATTHQSYLLVVHASPFITGIPYDPMLHQLPRRKPLSPSPITPDNDFHYQK